MAKEIKFIKLDVPHIDSNPIQALFSGGDDEIESWEVIDEPKKKKNTLKLYEMHTNFYIDKEILMAIADIEGVEALKVTTPYRAIIWFGLLFQTQKIKNDIRKTLSKIICQSNK